MLKIIFKNFIKLLLIINLFLKFKDMNILQNKYKTFLKNN